MNEHENLIARLRALGSQPVRPDVAEQHLAAIERPETAGPGFWGNRLKVVAAFAVGLLAGTTGLATAGALPHSAQEVAHRTLGAVGLNVPHGDRYQGPECGGTFRNHGEYVRSQPKGKRAEAAASRCGKPIQAGVGDEAEAENDGEGRPGGPCQGPPPWAGKGRPDAAAKAAWQQRCGEADDDGADEEETPAPAAEGQPTPAGPETPAATAPGATSETTATTETTAPPAGTETTDTTGTDTTGTTETTETTDTTVGSDGPDDDGGTAPSLPVEPPAGDQAP